MSKQDNLTDFLTDVADAIREKKGTTEKINPQDFSEEIRGIESGGTFNADVSFGNEKVFGASGWSNVVINEGVETIGKYGLCCYQGKSITLPSTLKDIEDYGMYKVSMVRELILPNNLRKLGTQAFASMGSLNRVIMPTSVESLPSYLFYGTVYVDFVKFVKTGDVVPQMASTSAVSSIREACKFVVPDDMYDEWIVATNWSAYADRIVKASEFVEPTNE